MELHELDLMKVVNDREFYRLPPGFFGGQKHGDEVLLLEKGLHLLRSELFRLRLREQGLTEEWIQERMPEFVPGAYHYKADRSIIHTNLRRQIEYVRADVLVAAARLKRREARRK